LVSDKTNYISKLAFVTQVTTAAFSKWFFGKFCAFISRGASFIVCYSFAVLLGAIYGFNTAVPW